MPGKKEEALIPMFVPPLVALLEHAETLKGKPLTQKEVEKIRDEGVCIMTPVSVATEVARKRGYPDIDPENAWEEWKNVRASMPRNRS